MIWYIVIIELILLVFGLIVGKRKRAKLKESERLHIQYINELETEERKKQQTVIDYLTAKVDNLIYISELTEKQLQAEKDDKKVLILRKQLQTIDDNIFRTQQKLNKELEKLE